MKHRTLRTRAVAAALTGVLLTSCVVTGAGAAGVTAGDIAGHWAQDSIQYALDQGWMGLDQAGDFLPDATITREEFAHLLNQALGLEDESILYFSDTADAQYYDDIAKAVRAGYMIGKSDASFSPDGLLSRAEAATILARLLPAQEGQAVSFTDFDQVGDWAKSSVLTASQSGYITGNPDGTFAPQRTLTRAEAVQMVVALTSGETIQKGHLNITANNQVIRDTIVAGNVYVDPAVTSLTMENCVVLGNVYVDGSATLNFSGRARVVEAKGQAKVTLGSDTAIEYLYLWGSNNTVDAGTAQIHSVVAYGSTDITGTPTLDLLRANADGVTCSVQPGEITIGEMTKQMPVIAGKSYVASTSPTVSPDKDKIISTAKTLPTMTELPYDEGVTYHQGVYDKSHPFSSMYCSVGSVSLEDNQYIEKEFLMSGKANVYNLYDNDTPYIVSADNPYATRILVRYPDVDSGKKFSGRVYLDILNASSGIDLEDVWRRSYQHFMDSGDVYIGITSQSGTAEALKRFDSERYADINWRVNGELEDGLFFDMLSQLGNLLRDDPHAILPENINPEYVYVTGQSWSGDYLNTYSSVFYDYYNQDRSLFDGYVSIVSPAETFIASNVAGPRDVYTETKEPYFVIMSQGEHYFGSYGDWYLDFEYVRIPDASEDNYKFRFYEVAGAGHSDPVSPILPNNDEIALANNGTGRDPKVYNGDEKPSDLQLDMIITASLENVHNWAANGVPAPSGEDYWLEYRTVVDPFVKDMPETVEDEHHNALGGIRMPQIEVPVAQYKPFRNDSSTTDGSMIYFDSDTLKALYPQGYEQYKAAFDAAAKKVYDEGFVIESDYEKLIASDANRDLFE